MRIDKKTGSPIPQKLDDVKKAGKDLKKPEPPQKAEDAKKAERAQFDLMRAKQHEAAFKEKSKIVDKMLEISELLDLSINPSKKFLDFLNDPANKAHKESLSTISKGIQQSIKEREEVNKQQALIKAKSKGAKGKPQDEVMPEQSEMEAYMIAYNNMVPSAGYSMIRYLLTNPLLSNYLSANLDALKKIHKEYKGYVKENKNVQHKVPGNK